MDYNPDKDMPLNLEQYEQLISHRLAKEDEMAAANPDYVKQSRAEIESTYACYYPQETSD